jgi:protein-disulfide isomerase
MRIIKTLLTMVLLALPAAAVATDFDNMSADEKAAFGRQVRAYILENPEILLEAFQVLEEQQKASEFEADLQRVLDNRDALSNDGFSFVGGNPEGDLTMVEFLDYRCGYCRKAHKEVAKLLADDGNIRWVVKEFPILGEASTISSQVAVATLRVLGPEAYLALHNELMTFSGPMTESAIGYLLKKIGQDADAVLAEMNAEAVLNQIKETNALARTLVVNGTPTFVIGDRIVRGYLSPDEMLRMVKLARNEAN